MKLPISFFAAACMGMMLGSISQSALAAASDRGQKAAVSERASFGPTAWHQQQHQAALHRQLSAERAAQQAAHGYHVIVSQAERIDIGDAECKECKGLISREKRLRIGVVKTLNIQVDFSEFPRDNGRSRGFSSGTVHQSNGLNYVWNTNISSPGARALRLRFAELDLPRGVSLYVYSNLGSAFGPYTGSGPDASGEFWSQSLAGDSVSVQMKFPADMSRSDLARMRFSIADIGYIGSKFTVPLVPSQQAGLCGFNAPCVENATCNTAQAWAGISDAQGGVAKMQFVSGRYVYLCSGGLLADTDTGSAVPLFLTANHCISKGREANSLETFWQYTKNCDAMGDCPSDSEAVRASQSGATILSTNRTSDYTLMELKGTPPMGSVFLGWSSAPVADTHNLPLYRVSHPRGAPQAYSQHDVDTIKGTCSSWPRGAWIYSKDIVGATEGGSSGSPVMNASGQVVGQLSGACGTNVTDNCDPASNATVDGALAAYFSSVEQWLDPQGGPVDPPDSCLIPGGDPVGTACSTGSTCCSGKCKGKPGSMTCR